MKPLNRMVLVEPLAEEESSKPAFYLPDDIVVNKKEFEVVTVKSVADDSRLYDVLSTGDKIIVEGHMLRQIEVSGAACHLILENHVLGVVK
tara:strand:+ start:539 stop:811 length:273 start_codon:yes stop_codon:yes gene_type:complete